MLELIIGWGVVVFVIITFGMLIWSIIVTETSKKPKDLTKNVKRREKIKKAFKDLEVYDENKHDKNERE